MPIFGWGGPLPPPLQPQPQPPPPPLEMAEVDGVVNGLSGLLGEPVEQPLPVPHELDDEHEGLLVEVPLVAPLRYGCGGAGGYAGQGFVAMVIFPKRRDSTKHDLGVLARHSIHRSRRKRSEDGSNSIDA